MYHVFTDFSPKVLNFPGKSCKDSATAATIRRWVGELCSSDQEEMVLVIVSMFVNGIFNRMGEQPNKAKEVDRELDAHQDAHYLSSW